MASSPDSNSSSSEKKLSKVVQKGTWKCDGDGDGDNDSTTITKNSESASSSQSSTPPSSSQEHMQFYLPPLRKRPKISYEESSSSSVTMERRILTKEDFISHTGSSLNTFSLFKDWAENSLFLFREGDALKHGTIYATADVKIYLENGAGPDLLNWPGPFKGCIKCIEEHEKSDFGLKLLTVNWQGLKQHCVPDDVPPEIKDLCICARTAATTRFGDAAIK